MGKKGKRKGKRRSFHVKPINTAAEPMDGQEGNDGRNVESIITKTYMCVCFSQHDMAASKLLSLSLHRDFLSIGLFGADIKRSC